MTAIGGGVKHTFKEDRRRHNLFFQIGYRYAGDII